MNAYTKYCRTIGGKDRENRKFRSKRRLHVERLESRQLLSAETSTWHFDPISSAFDHPINDIQPHEIETRGGKHRESASVAREIHDRPTDRFDHDVHPMKSAARFASGSIRMPSTPGPLREIMPILTAVVQSQVAERAGNALRQSPGLGSLVDTPARISSTPAERPTLITVTPARSSAQDRFLASLVVAVASESRGSNQRISSLLENERVAPSHRVTETSAAISDDDADTQYRGLQSSSPATTEVDGLIRLEEVARGKRRLSHRGTDRTRGPKLNEDEETLDPHLDRDRLFEEWFRLELWDFEDQPSEGMLNHLERTTEGPATQTRDQDNNTPSSSVDSQNDGTTDDKRRVSSRHVETSQSHVTNDLGGMIEISGDMEVQLESILIATPGEIIDGALVALDETLVHGQSDRAGSKFELAGIVGNAQAFEILQTHVAVESNSGSVSPETPVQGLSQNQVP